MLFNIVMCVLQGRIKIRLYKNGKIVNVLIDDRLPVIEDDDSPLLVGYTRAVVVIISGSLPNPDPATISATVVVN